MLNRWMLAMLLLCSALPKIVQGQTLAGQVHADMDRMSSVRVTSECAKGIVLAVAAIEATLAVVLVRSAQTKAAVTLLLGLNLVGGIVALSARSGILLQIGAMGTLGHMWLSVLTSTTASLSGWWISK